MFCMESVLSIACLLEDVEVDNSFGSLSHLSEKNWLKPL